MPVKSVQVRERSFPSHAPALNSIQHAILAKKTSLDGSALISHVLSKGQIPPKKAINPIEDWICFAYKSTALPSGLWFTWKQEIQLITISV